VENASFDIRNSVSPTDWHKIAIVAQYEYEDANITHLRIMMRQFVP